mgnify:CR=1 FL=1
MSATKNRVNETYLIREFLRELGNTNLKSLPTSVMRHLKSQSIYFETDSSEYVVSPFGITYKTKGKVGREWYGYNTNRALFRLIRIALGDKLHILKAEIDLENKELIFYYDDGEKSSIELVGAGIFKVVKPDTRVLMLKYDEMIDRFVSVSFIVEPIRIIEEAG